MEEILTRCPKCGHQMKQRIRFTVGNVVEATGEYVCINCGYRIKKRSRKKQKTITFEEISEIGC